VDEDYRFARREYEVGFAWQIAAVEAKSVSQPMGGLPHR
jgi:hypothetical protein